MNEWIMYYADDKKVRACKYNKDDDKFLVSCCT